MDKNKIVIISIGVIILIIALYLWWKKKQDVPVAETVQETTPISETVEVKSIFPLKYGSKNKEVKQVQAYLLRQGIQFPLHGIDGQWGDETDRNIKRGLKVSEITESLFKQLGIDKVKV